MRNNMINKKTITKETKIQTKEGVIFAKTWQPIEKIINNNAIILFHDSLGCTDLWRNLPTILSEKTGRKVVSYDRLGFGKSDIRSDKMTFDFIQREATDIIPAICKKLNIESFVALGHSVGGGMAVNSAALHSNMCEGLITIAAQTFPEKLTLDSIRKAKKLFQDQGQIDRLARYHGSRTKWVIDAWVQTWLSPEFLNWSLKNILPKVICPTLVIHGSEDEYGTKAHPEMIAHSVTGSANLEIMPDTHHLPHRENETWVTDRISLFLSGC